MLTYSALLFVFIINLVTSNNQQVQALSLSIPTRARVEGQITLVLPDGDQVIKHHLPFSESIDSIAGKAKLSIGYISREPTNYYIRRSLPTLTLGRSGTCEVIREESIFVPELYWFVELLLPKINLIHLTSTLVGPTGLFGLASQLTSSVPFTFDRDATHRDVPCEVHSRLITIREQEITIKLEIFVPTSGVKFHNVKTTFFSIKVTTFDIKSSNDNNDPHKLGVFRASFTIDYYNIDSFDGEPERFELIKEDFNLPLARGCSQFIQKFQPYVSNESFQMNYYQTSTSDYMTMAYDHNNGFLRKEWPSKSFSIWDLNEDLLYHVNTNLMNNLHSNVLYPSNVATCSVLKITDEKLNSAYRPYKVVGKSLDVLQFMGANSLSFIGHSYVRDMPCYIYESILEEPPIVFSMTEEHLMYKKMHDKIDYIVQFHILKSNGANKLSEQQLELTINEFWPAKIRIYLRFKKQQQQQQVDNQYSIKLLDELNIYDFSASLDGGDKKSVELFMAPECFQTDNDEELKIELAIKFDKVHNIDSKEDDKKLLSFNKNRLEYFLINDLINLFQFSRMHLIDYNMRLLPHHVNLDLTFNNRNELKSLIHFGEGYLPSENAYESNRLIVQGQSEESCVLFSSLITDISMVVYCPELATNQGTTESESSNKQSYDISNCIAVYGENEPIIKNIVNENPNVPSCQVYRYIPTESPLKAATTSTIAWEKFALEEHKFNNFEAVIPPGYNNNNADNMKDKNKINSNRTIKLNAAVLDYDLKQEIKFEVIDNYMFAEDQPSDMPSKHVKSFESVIDYKNEGDCAKMCNLDASCRSYSYCRIKASDKTAAVVNDQDQDKSNQARRCAWSTLDLREAKVKEQLVYLSPLYKSDGRMITVKGDVDGLLRYNIKFLDHCDIYERNYLNLFKETDEIYSIKQDTIHQFQAAKSAFECAKQSVDLELLHKDHHVAMFAYCPKVNICLLDESLFKKTTTITNGFSTTSLNIDEDSTNNNDNNLERNKETLCKVYRKKYQTYFNVSSSVLKLNEHQIEFEFNTVEECARGCWIKFGHVCASFDYCSTTNTCLINQIDVDLIDGKIKGTSGNFLNFQESHSIELETRPNCLHYQRDFVWDKLNQGYSLGRHVIFKGDKLKEINNKHTFGGVFGTFLAYTISICAFFYGLLLGVRMNDKMDTIKIIRQSISGESGADRRRKSLSNSKILSSNKKRTLSQNQMFGFQSFNSNGDYLSAEDVCHNDDEEIEMGNNHSNAIRLDVISNVNERKTLD